MCIRVAWAFFDQFSVSIVIEVLPRSTHIYISKVFNGTGIKVSCIVFGSEKRPCRIDKADFVVGVDVIDDAMTTHCHGP